MVLLYCAFTLLRKIEHGVRNIEHIVVRCDDGSTGTGVIPLCCTTMLLSAYSPSVRDGSFCHFIANFVAPHCLRSTAFRCHCRQPFGATYGEAVLRV